MNKSFVAEVLKLRPNLRVAGNFFYTSPFDHLLCGFVREKGSGRSYIWRYALPLYDHIDFLHLTFGARLPRPDGSMANEHDIAGDAAAEFIRRIEPYEETTYAMDDIGKFLSLVESMQYIDTPQIRWALATTLVMLGRGEEAESQLRNLSDKPANEALPHFLDDVRQLSSELSIGVDRARRCLLTWEARTKARFGLQL